MMLKTKYNEGDIVWLINLKTGQLVQREIAGVRSQSINKVQSTIYCFIKDWSLNNENPTLEDCFWVSETKVHDTKQKLIESF
ncbi:hypothetical protein M2451_004001 [Dysgonomonas sp. PFB1-18]|uniref:hypothetical protein n=1 Tax=unclassified Dysgonomonas TaxID=2630389 RepID=UPI002474A2C9|nr:MULTISPECIES: hypothetical protein [unclassified Dysgonomonas]MDH6311130.1 hypothetical protein [Dysgonomonas sp. PF1-14]MDH6341016.1 hypothetical protein [Dysgonomonas sp. PF1-16]MDH6382656.1 hypothetical protein [Dysgonomonas sp. PFB1-18]MDH6399995.1 hypothetical protein [Dysgonomonas sp. PF1-23]